MLEILGWRIPGLDSGGFVMNIVEPPPNPWAKTMGGRLHDEFEIFGIGLFPIKQETHSSPRIVHKEFWIDR